jgi:electron transport complex protein RnfC
MKNVNNFVSPSNSSFADSVRAFLPRTVKVPLRQSDGIECQCAFKPGDFVREGQIIASSGEFSAEGANIHSSVPGKVVSISRCTLSDGTMGMAAEISTGGIFTFLGKKNPPMDWNFMNPVSILDEFKSKGVVNTFRAKTVSLSQEIKKSPLQKNRFVVVRLFDDDPSRCTDSFVAKNYAENVVEGARIVAKAFFASGIAFAFPKNEKFAVNGNFSSAEHLEVPVDTSKYPAGLKPDLIRAVKKFAKISGADDFLQVNHKSLFVDAETCLSAYEAVSLGIPVMERFVHVSGGCLKSSGIFKVRIGESFRSLVEQCGGFSSRPAKIIVNGKILGHSIFSLDVPVSKSTKSLEFVPSMEICSQKETECVRCGKCRSVCPESLSPDLLYKFSAGKYQLPKELAAAAVLCSGCALCNCVCPSRLPLSQAISLVKE